MTDANMKSSFQRFLEVRANEKGITVHELLATERVLAACMDGITDDCLFPDEAERLILAGVRQEKPFVIKPVELPLEMRDAGGHVMFCDFCQCLIGIMTSSVLAK